MNALREFKCILICCSPADEDVWAPYINSFKKKHLGEAECRRRSMTRRFFRQKKMNRWNDVRCFSRRGACERCVLFNLCWKSPPAYVLLFNSCSVSSIWDPAVGSNSCIRSALSSPSFGWWKNGSNPEHRHHTFHVGGTILLHNSTLSFIMVTFLQLDAACCGSAEK